MIGNGGSFVDESRSGLRVQSIQGTYRKTEALG